MKFSLHSLIHFLPFLVNHLRVPSPEFDQILDNNCSLETSRYIASGRTPGKHRLLLSRIDLGVFTDPLPSNRRPTVARVGSRGNVFTESLPINGSIRHNIILSRVQGFVTNKNGFWIG
jgi:hypothetical protein